MKIVFFSNFLNHHQLPFCQELYKAAEVSFHFVATEPIFEEQLALGYPDLNKEYPFVVRTYEDVEQKNTALQLGLDADIAIIGSAPMEFVQQRLKENKLTFRYSERIYKEGYQAWKLPIRLLRFYRTYGRYKSFYLLCASAYTAGDFAKTFTFLNKAYKWGYFPEVNRYEDMPNLIEQKKFASILWVARLIELKHPEAVIAVADRLKADGYKFQLSMIGIGPMQQQLEEMINEKGLNDCVFLLGAMSPEQVRKHMEQSEIFLFTSDRNEGWGAVMNESMNSGCAVVASDAVGSVPFLLHSGKNGLTYESGNVDDLYEKVKFLLDNSGVRKSMGLKAYESMTTLWNAEVAAQRLLALSRALLNGEKSPQLYENGPCSKASPIP